MFEEKTVEQRQREIRHGLRLRLLRPGVGRIRGGKRKDLDSEYTRSSWEANYERYLNQMEIQWEYEKKTFWFEGVKSGTVNYTPDFYLPEYGQWHEVKGRWTTRSKTQLRRFRKYHPDEFAKLYVVTSDIYGNSKTARSVRRFLLCELNLPPERIISYPALDKKYRSIITNWE